MVEVFLADSRHSISISRPHHNLTSTRILLADSGNVSCLVVAVDKVVGPGVGGNPGSRDISRSIELSIISGRGVDIGYSLMASDDSTAVVVDDAIASLLVDVHDTTAVRKDRSLAILEIAGISIAYRLGS